MALSVQANSQNVLVAKLIERNIADGVYKPIYMFPEKQRPAVRMSYVDMTITQVNTLIDQRNRMPGNEKKQWPRISSLPDTAVARIACAVDSIKRVRNDRRVSLKQAALAVYVPETGIYDFNPDTHRQLMYQYSRASNHFVEQATKALGYIAEPALSNQDPDLICFANGVLDRKNKRLLKHSPDMIFTSALEVNYNPNAENPHFKCSDGSDWDVESWINSLSLDRSVSNLIWEVIAACLRPNNHWNKTPWLYSTIGANGKGTLCQLIRMIVGSSSCASLPISDFDQPFMLQQLLNTTCVVTDENPVGVPIDNASAYKAAVTGDVFTINRKYQDPIAMSYSGIILQCMNSMPQVRDRTGSFYRRQLFIPMERNFAEEGDKPEIKNRFVCDERVCEYVAKRCMDMEFDTFSNPARCKQVLEEYKVYNDMVREFVHDMMPQIPYKFIPYEFIWDVYKAWCADNYKDSKLLGRRMFLRDFQAALRDYRGYVVTPLTARWRNKPEDFTEECELLYKYDLAEWRAACGKTPSDTSAFKRPNAERFSRRQNGVFVDEEHPHTDPDLPDYDSDDADITYIDSDMCDTDATTLRDYGLDSDDKISDGVAAQLKADPDSIVPECPYDIRMIDNGYVDDEEYDSPDETAEVKAAANAIANFIRNNPKAAMDGYLDKLLCEAIKGKADSGPGGADKKTRGAS